MLGDEYGMLKTRTVAIILNFESSFGKNGVCFFE